MPVNENGSAASAASVGIIYGLVDPRTGIIRYVGQSRQGRERVWTHLSNLRHGRHQNSRLQRWFTKTRRQGLPEPGYLILEACAADRLSERERAWIVEGNQNGWRLCNLTAGGESTEHCAMTRSKIAAGVRRKWSDDSYRSRIVAHLARHPRKKKSEAAKRATRIGARRRRRWRLRSRRDAELATLTPLTREGAAFVPLTAGRYAIIDAVDWPRVSEHVWSCQMKGEYFRAKTNVRRVDGSRTCVLLSRFIVGANEQEEVRHSNGNQLDCRRQTLVVLPRCP
jgi:hypothetical protein